MSKRPHSGGNLGFYREPLKRTETEEIKRGPIVAYDLETTNIPELSSKGGSVDPLYFTCYGQSHRIGVPLVTYQDLAVVLDTLFRSLENGTRLCAWNANRFDLRLVLAALVETFPQYTCYPFVAKGGALRGCLVEYSYGRQTRSFYFLDGMNMTGLSCTLRTFLKTFAPGFAKLHIDFSRSTFDIHNPHHIAYAMRDAEGLYHGLQAAEEVARKLTGRGLQVTIGNAGVKAFAKNLPPGVAIYAPDPTLDKVMRTSTIRGGYVYAKGSYDGPGWSYDVNQAYAAAMRETDLPAGRCSYTTFEVKGLPGIYSVELSRAVRAPVPFYVRDLQGNAIDAWGDPVQCSLTSDELRCLRRHGWEYKVLCGWYWGRAFRMTRFVNKLERLRREHPSGTPINAFCKSLGNNAYGKTLEQVPPWSYILTQTPPKGASPADIVLDDNGNAWGGFIWMKHERRDTRRAYHRPQLGAFITASVRVKLYDAIMLAPDAFLKADTDGITFSRPVDLPIHPSTYGLWKVESNGARHIIIGKKTYAVKVGKRFKYVCKGLHTKYLSVRIYRRWLRTGEPPEQEQMQLQSWKKGFRPTYVKRKRKGTDFRKERKR